MKAFVQDAALLQVREVVDHFIFRKEFLGLKSLRKGYLYIINPATLAFYKGMDLG